MTTDADEYPPLTPLADLPLHPDIDREAGEWFGCEFPERPPDDGMQWDWRCRSCTLHATAVLINHGDEVVSWTQDGETEPVPRMLSWNIERAKYWNEEATWLR